MDDTKEHEPEDEQPDPVAELTKQVQLLDRELASVKDGLNTAFYLFLGMIAVAFIIGMVAVFSNEPDKPDNEIKDYSSEQILEKGPHCYKERAEMLAARQRALQEASFVAWQRENPIPEPSDNMMSLPRALDATPLPTVRPIDDNEKMRAKDEKGADPSLCFYVQYGERKWDQ